MRTVAFFSYTRADDADCGGLLSRIREDLERQLSAELGEPVAVFQDVDDIKTGEDWRAKLETALREATVLGIAVTPRFFNSQPCRDELARFLAKADAAGTPDLVLPILWRRVRDLGGAAALEADALQRRVEALQYVDWSTHRSKTELDPTLREEIGALAEQVADRLHTWAGVGRSALTTSTGSGSIQSKTLAAPPHVVVPRGRRSSVLCKTLHGHSHATTCVAFLPDGGRAVSGSADGTVRIWDLDTGREFGKRGDASGVRIWSVAPMPSGRYVLTGLDDGGVRIWDLETGLEARGALRVHTGPVFSIAIAAHGRRAISGSADGTLIRWDLENWRMVGSPLTGHEAYVRAVAVTPDGRLAVSGSHDKTVRRWNLRTGLQIGAPLEGHSDWVRSVAVSPDGWRAVSGADDETWRIWDLDAGRDFGAPRKGHDGWIRCVAIDPSGRRVLTGSADRTPRVWDFESGRPLCDPLRGHSRDIWALAVSPDGRSALSAGGDLDQDQRDDDSIRLWDLSAL